jgi:hypothetical protein
MTEGMIGRYGSAERRDFFENKQRLKPENNEARVGMAKSPALIRSCIGAIQPMRRRTREAGPFGYAQGGLFAALRMTIVVGADNGGGAREMLRP